MSAAPEREQALRAVVELIERHRLTIDDVAVALASRHGGDRHAAARSATLTKLLGYLGGVFVFAGIGVFIAMQWDEMTPPARVIATLGSGLACFAMAFVALKDERFATAVTPLFLIAALLEPVGILVVLDEYAEGSDWHHASLLTNSVMLAQQFAAFASTRRTSLLFTSLVFGVVLVATAMDYVGVDEEWIWAAIGASLLSLMIGIQKTPQVAVTPFWYLVATAALLGGLFGVLRGEPLEVLFVGVACGMVYASVQVRSRSILIVATLAILGYIGYYTQRHFVDTIGWPIALIVLGLAMLGLSASAVVISRRYISAE